MTDTDDNGTDNVKPPPPTERAVTVALKQEDETKAPRVVAAGRGTVAEQILALAFAHGIKVREDPDLAELLSAVDLDSEIPVEAFTAVAEILSYVYRANGDTDAAERAANAVWHAESDNQPTKGDDDGHTG